MTPEQAAQLRAPFPPEQIQQRPQPLKKDSPKGNCAKCGGFHGMPAMHLDYVGHAEATDRLLQVDPEWTWRPFNQEEVMSLPPALRDGGLWIWLTVAGVTRPGFGDATGKTGANAVKEMIGDAIRNAGMRFGLALDLWAKSDLQQQHEPDVPPRDLDLENAQAACRAAWETNQPWDWQAFSAAFEKWAKTSVDAADAVTLLAFAGVLREQRPAIEGHVVQHVDPWATEEKAS